MPFIANYYLTLRCNALCDFCNIPHTNNHAPPPEPTLEQIESNLEGLKRLGVRVVDFTGGEPLLYRELPEALGIAKRLGLMTSVTSNGMLYPKYADALKGKINALLFSIDAPDRDTHDKVRGVKSWDSAVEAVRIAKALNETVFISHVVTNEAMPYVEDMIRFARSLGTIIYLNPCFSFFGNEGLSPDNARLLQRHFLKPGVIIDRAQLRLISSGGNHVADPVCRAVSSTVVISPDNKILLPCYHFKNDAVPIDGPLDEVWHSSRVQRARALEGRHEFCEGCTVYCYMRGSLFRRYPVDTIRGAAHYVRERVRSRLPVLSSSNG
jgi:MoaA/NifB/PqqE/SkfB family radical SAM enzyme